MSLNRTPEEAQASLQLVVREVATELNEARTALEAFAEQTAETGSLERFVAHLHLARGALRIVEVYGGALLAEEMEQTCRYVETHQRDGKVDMDGLDALVRAMEQLPSYVERVASGGRDVPLALLPLLNDLRAVRGASLLSEGTLLLLNLRSDEPARPAGDAAHRPPAAELARKARSRFQLALLGWIRGENAVESLGVIEAVATDFESTATTQPLFQLWWVVGALVEALQQGGLEAQVSVKRLLGQVDREMRRLGELGEARWADAPPAELLNNLLYYVARSTASGPRVTAVRRSFRLEEVLAADDGVGDTGDTLSGPSVRLMKTVASAIREDLTRVKDVLDIFVRRGGTEVDELVPQLEMLRKISDTLGVLGLGALRDRVQGEIESLQRIVERHEPPGEAALLDVAAALIEVEDGLDPQLLKLIVPDAGRAVADDEEPGDEEFRQVRDAVLRECIVNMARIKEAVTQALGAPSEAQGLDQVPQLVRGITAGLLMLGKQRAVEAMEGVGRALAGIVRPDPASLSPDRLDRMADAMVAVEYYMEMLQAGRPDPWRVLDGVEASLADLTSTSTKIVPLRPAARTAAEAAAAVPPPEAAPAPVVTPVPAPAAAPAPPAPAVPTSVDPEFLALFVEEARENVASVRQLFPLWEANPQDATALRDLRRVFHTLKGSGRMVGASRVSEFSWSVENLLNRVISQTLARSAEIVSVVRDAVAALPSLVDELESGTPADVDVTAIAARADALAGREATPVPPPAPAEPAAAAPQATVEPVVEAAPAEAPEAEPTPTAMDPVLHEIFSKETASHVAAVREFIARAAQSVSPHPVTETLYRACHTLSGIAKTAGARQGIKVAEPMEHYVRKLHDNGRGLTDEALLLLGDTVRGLEQVVAHVDEDTGYFPGHGHLIAGWQALEHALDAELAAPAVEAVAADVATPADAFAAGSAGEAGREETEPHLLMAELPPGEPLPVEARFAQDDGPAPGQEPEFDADIAAIFGEEAAELLEVADSALSSWIGDRADGSRVSELKRVLHTLKGGARMAGIRAMGDLSHEMESFLASIESGGVEPDGEATAVLRAALDELHRMRDAVLAGHAVLPARALVERVQALAARSANAAPVDAVAPPEAVAPAEAPAPAESPEPAFETTIATDAAPPDMVPDVAEAERPAHEAVAPPADAVEPSSEPGPVFAEPPPAAETPPATWPDRPVTDEAPPAAAPYVLPGREPVVQPERHELARVSAELLDELLNNAGEVSIFRARVEQQLTSAEFNLAELGRTVTRLREQLRKLELETEAQILHRHQDERTGRDDFDPLELDRYSTIQQLSRALAESVSDVASIENLLESVNRDGQNLLQQQGRVIAELQNGLMRTRMVPFQRHAQRLTRLTRQAALEAGKKADLVIEGGTGEIDRQVLERMLPPFEHMLRNSIVHGIELPEDRLARGKAETGRIVVRLQREGAEVVITVEDDGAGLDIPAIRAKARQMGLLGPDQVITDEEALQLILEPGFSTATRLTQQAGRGVGMDVVASEVKKLGGGLFIESNPGRGARFTIRLPFTLAITQALIVRIHDEVYALPVATVEGVARIPASEVRARLVEDPPAFTYGGHVYRFQHLGNFIGSGPSDLPPTDAPVPVILVRAGEHSTALVTDELVGNREIVVKSVGPQVASVRGISGATILGDGRIVIILDMGALVRSEWRARAPDVSVRAVRDDRTFALVVDDSITVRRVTQRLLERNGMRVMTAKDGVDALELLQEHVPDVILLDIEMPRMDGYEVASHVRGDPRLADVPIIMITSRVGDKHRARAIELGIDDYLGKPYQESQLLDAIEPLVLARRRQMD
ncbi:MAG: Hpt domain-containing protein [Steroidobacteraceae bacterium]